MLTGEWRVGWEEDVEGREEIETGLQGELIFEFHIKGEMGVTKGRWGRRREAWGFRPSTGQEQGPGVCLLETLSTPVSRTCRGARVVDGEEEEQAMPH